MTYSRSDVLLIQPGPQVLEDGITIGGKPLKDHFEAVGHSEAFDLLYKLADSQDISEDDILGLHRLFYYRIES